jgi:hypothetical protein
MFHFTCVSLRLVILFFLLFSAGLGSVYGLNVTGYTSVANDRFANGFPIEPVPNSSPSFVGVDYDWSGVAWSTTTFDSSSYKGFGLLSPVHFLAAQHYEYESRNQATSGIMVLGRDSAVSTADVSSMDNLGQGLVLTLGGNTNNDLAVGTLSSALSPPSNTARYAVLDLHNASGSDTLSNYNSVNLLLYGRGATTDGSPRIGAASVDLVSTFGSADQIAIRTTRADVQLQVGDSGSPAFAGWTNPNGQAQLALLGLNSAIDTTNGFNYISFLGSTAAMGAANNVMTPAGYALRVAGGVSNTWVGTSSTSISNKGAWGIGPGPSQAPSDKYVLFDGATAGSGRVVTVDSNTTLRGLYFKATESSELGFALGGTSTLTLGRGGVTNYDNSRQIITANLTLGDHQYWEVGPGGVTAQNINTNGKLLEIAGEGTTIVTGAISGSGGLALSESRLELLATSSYTGTTWVHQGQLVVGGNIASSAGFVLGQAGRLSGLGTVSVISGSGSVEPGNSPGILTASAINPAGGLGFVFEFTQIGSPNYGQSNNSGNDVLYLTDPTTPLLSALTAANSLDFFLSPTGGLQENDVLRGGFFVTQPDTLTTSLGAATVSYFVADPSGHIAYEGINYNAYDGPLSFVLGVTAESANFGSGTVDGHVLEITVIPEPSTHALALGLVAFGLLAARRRG